MRVRRRGIGVLELVVALAIVLIVIAAVSYFLIYHLKDARVAAEAEGYNSIRTGFTVYVAKYGFPEDSNYDDDYLDDLILKGAISPNARSSFKCVDWKIRRIEDVSRRVAYYIEVGIDRCSEGEKEQVIKTYRRLDDSIDDGDLLKGVVRVKI